MQTGDLVETSSIRLHFSVCNTEGPGDEATWLYINLAECSYSVSSAQTWPEEDNAGQEKPTVLLMRPGIGRNLDAVIGTAHRAGSGESLLAVQCCSMILG